MADESATTIHARTCHLCEANCGVLVEVQGRTVVSIRGNPDHVLSRGHICPKATALADLQDDPDRLRRPMKRTENGWQAIDWDVAYAEIAARVPALLGRLAARAQTALARPFAARSGDGPALLRALVLDRLVAAGLVAHIVEEQASPSGRFIWDTIEHAIPFDGTSNKVEDA
mgnify:CR=1 FL=1